MRRSGRGAALAAALAAAAVLAACAPRAAPDGARERGRIAGEAARNRAPGPLTRAERSGYAETSRHADVLSFLDSLAAAAPGVVSLGTVGTTTEGRAIPYAVASRPLVRTPEEARRLGRPVVYVQGNIHGGEVEGKEALLALLRDLARAPGPGVLDSVVLVAVPIYNADGNERFGAQAANRGEQNGPELVGQRANAAGLDLNRDYVKAEAPETRASLAMFARWDPELFVDLHTTNGSYHGYALTYAPSLTPAAPRAAHTRDALLPELRRRVRARHGLATFDYGNFSVEYGADVSPDTVKQGWFTYDHRPRFGTNYYGLRGATSLLSEAYSHDPFERRVRATYAFVREALSLAAERRGELRAPAAAGGTVAVRAELTRTPYVGPVVAEDLARTGDSSLTEPGVPRGLRRTGRFRTVRIPVHDRFTATLVRPLPAAYLLGADDTAAVRLLRLHGVRVDPITAPLAASVRVFVVDSVARAARPFQGHREATLAGRWSEPRAERVAAGGYAVPAGQRFAPLAAYLLEPESDDGLATWNLFDDRLRPGAAFPVRQAVTLGAP
jgi:hypothetical protein